MKTILSFVGAAAIALCAVAVAPAQAQAPTCSDLEWSAELLASHPKIADACEAVVQRGGTNYAMFTAYLERRYFNGDVKLRINKPDGGYITDVFSPPKNFEAKMGDKWVTLGQIPERRVPFHVYVPEGQWMLASLPENEVDVVVVYAEPVEEPAEPEPAPMLPATGGVLPLLGLLGGLFAALGAGLTFVRRRKI